jgi:hypothetical protein
VKKTTILFTLISCIFLVTITSSVFAQNRKPLETDKDKISYIVGNNIARSLMQIKEEIDFEKLIEGLQDQFHEKPLQVTEEESQMLMQTFSTKMKKKQERRIPDFEESVLRLCSPQ